MEALYDFDELPRGEQKEKLMIIKNVAMGPLETKDVMMQLYKVTQADLINILASRRLWNGYSYFNALLRPDKGQSYNTKQIEEIKKKIEALL